MTPPRWLHWPAGGGSWSPSSLSLIGWYEADAITGLNNNDTFSTWADVSSASNDMTTLQGSYPGSTDPVYKTSVLNSKPIVAFPRTTDRLAASIELVSNWMVATVFRFATTSGGSNRAVWCTETSTGNRNAPNAAHFWQSSTFRSYSAGSTTQYQTLFAASAGTWNLVVETRDGGGGTGERSARRDGTGILSVTDADQSSQRGVLALGRGVVGAADLEFAEVVVADSTPSLTDIEKLEGYLAHKWGLTSNLPSTHPYKSSAP